MPRGQPSAKGQLVVRLFELERENAELRRQVIMLKRRDISRGSLEADVKALRSELYARTGRGYVRRSGRTRGPARSAGDGSTA